MVVSPVTPSPSSAAAAVSQDAKPIQSVESDMKDASQSSIDADIGSPNIPSVAVLGSDGLPKSGAPITTASVLPSASLTATLTPSPAPPAAAAPVATDQKEASSSEEEEEADDPMPQASVEEKKKEKEDEPMPQASVEEKKEKEKNVEEAKKHKEVMKKVSHCNTLRHSVAVLLCCYTLHRSLIMFFVCLIDCS
jgi:hypothetical protein